MSAFEPAGRYEWSIVFSVIPAGRQAGDEVETTVTVWADTSAGALMEATRSLHFGLAIGDLIHGVHVSAPRKLKDKPE